MAKYEHLNLEDRCTIAAKLKNGDSFRSIGTAIGKDPSTISKEARSHLTFSKTGCLGHAYNNCIHRRSCKEAWICEDCKHAHRIG